ncbi:hypothetical protein KIH74_29750 [Kineosporia sp. J2-2]|uniref:Uncharacterized protein n=1 Tax=Kineosporia corallincola TaxID=2835133 RepID=A0ABS5TPY6_9ACTN|nr:hypothetical protein [Kineosporia corallincola]MBT0773165.1 hypothetical protein [Kineosporia corallincola]
MNSDGDKLLAACYASGRADVWFDPERDIPDHTRLAKLRELFAGLRRDLDLAPADYDDPTDGSNL